ncbi:MAG: peptide-binding protein [Chloroflexota bacterium]
MLVAALLVSLVAGCGKPKGPTKGGTITFGMTGDPVIFNPILSTDVPSSQVSDLVYSGLVKLNENLEPTGDLAERWESSSDGLTWTFHLRKGVKFHDGTPLTSADVKYTYDAIKDKDYTGVRATDFEPIESIETPDEYTVVLKLVEPYAPLLTNLTYGILPKHLFETTSIAQMKENPANMQPIGTGPYKYKEWQKGQYILLEANPDYFGGAPNIEKVIFKFYQDNLVMLAALEKGDIDYMGTIPADEVDRIKKDYADKFDFKEIADLGFTYIGLKQTNPLFTDVRVRQALMYGANRQQIVTDVLKGRAEVMNANLPSPSWGYAGDKLNQYAFDPDKAKALLEEAGWKVGSDGIRVKDGKRFSFKLITSTGNKTLEAALNIIQQNWKDIGVEANIEYIEWSVLCSQYLDVAKFEAYALGWSLGVDPDFYLYFHSKSAVEDGQLVGFNDVEFKNADLDKLLEEGRREMDQAKRKEIYLQAEKIVNEQLPYVFLYSQHVTSAMNKRVQGVVWTTQGWMDLHKWYVSDGK